MNMDIITLEDCLLQYELHGYTTIINDGKIKGFEIDTIRDLNKVYKQPPQNT